MRHRAQAGAQLVVDGQQIESASRTSQQAAAGQPVRRRLTDSKHAALHLHHLEGCLVVAWLRGLRAGRQQHVCGMIHAEQRNRLQISRCAKPGCLATCRYAGQVCAMSSTATRRREGATHRGAV
jgi:hypothetical protein